MTLLLTVSPMDGAVLIGAAHPGSGDLFATRQRTPAKTGGTVALIRAVSPVRLAGRREVPHNEHGAFPISFCFVFQASALRLVVVAVVVVAPLSY